MPADELLDRKMFRMPWKKGATKKRNDDYVTIIETHEGNIQGGLVTDYKPNQYIALFSWIFLGVLSPKLQFVDVISSYLEDHPRTCGLITLLKKSKDRAVCSPSLHGRPIFSWLQAIGGPDPA